MKNKYSTIASICLVFVFILFLASCNKDLGPESEKGLKLSDGYYTNVNNTPEETIYTIEFEYTVTGLTCQVDGFGIDYGEGHHGQVIWYMPKTLTPGQTYTITHTLKNSVPLTTNPVITMQGYLENDLTHYPELRDQITLKKK